MRVNTTWMNEAVRILWATCGEIKGLNYPYLQVCDLAALKATPSRLQWYANFVQIFWSTRSWKYKKTESGWYQTFRCDPKSHDSRYLQQFKGVDFPRLKSVLLGPTRQGPSPNDTRLIPQYLQPSLESLTVNTTYYSPKFFATLRTQCRSLRQLNLSCDDTTLRQRSEEGFEIFLLNSPTLSELTLHDNFQPWTEKIFWAVALHPSLHDLCAPRIPESWRLDATSNIFPSLRQLIIGLSERVLERLVPAFHKLSELSLFLSGPSHRAMNIMSNLSGLRKLSIDVSRSSGFTIHAEDLVAVAKNNPSLVQLACPIAGRDLGDLHIRAVGFSDTVMDEVAECLPQLEQFHMETDHPGILTEQTILSFGKRCKHLKNITMYAEMYWDELADDGEDSMFPRLNTLKALRPPSGEPSRCLDVYTVFERICAMCPSLCNLETCNFDLDIVWEQFCEDERQEYYSASV